MMSLFNQQNKIIVLTLTLVFLLTGSAIVFGIYGQIGLALTFLLGLISLLGIATGSVLALLVTLIVFFVLGSFVLWTPDIYDSLIASDIPLTYIIIWMAAMLLFSALSGQISYLIRELYQDKEALNVYLDQLVAVDPVTGFDNKDRMFLEIETEFTRSRRYGHTFTFLLLKMNRLDSFKQLYGEAEKDRLLQFVAEKINGLTRVSDLKFRPKENKIGILLTDTPSDDISVVIDKLLPQIETFQLSNGKYVTIPVETGYTSMEDVETYQDVFDLAEEQVSVYAT